jgi:hypothetical protein
MRYWLGVIRTWVYAEGFRPTPHNFLFYSPTLEIQAHLRDLALIKFFKKMNNGTLTDIKNEE